VVDLSISVRWGVERSRVAMSSRSTGSDPRMLGAVLR
jgi:hypothetical protein